MRKLIVLAVIFCIFPIIASSHPGKTDRYGGHKCLKECEEWNLYYAEYHLHDKDGKPIRISRKPKTQKKPALKSNATETVLPMVTDVPQTMQTVTVYRYITHIDEQRWPFNPLLLVLLVLLLLLLILRLNRKRSAQDPKS